MWSSRRWMFSQDLAVSGPVLEFAVGTGRIAAPLAARGVPVSGIELSRAMAARIAGKPGGDAVDVTIGDMTTTRVPGKFSLVYLVFNTISNVTTQDGQVAVFCQRGRAPAPRRAVPDRGRCARPAPPAARAGHASRSPWHPTGEAAVISDSTSTTS